MQDRDHPNTQQAIYLLLVFAIASSDRHLMRSTLGDLQSDRALSREQWSNLIHLLKTRLDACRIWFEETRNLSVETRKPVPFPKYEVSKLFCALLKKIVELASGKEGLQLTAQGFSDCFAVLKNHHLLHLVDKYESVDRNCPRWQEHRYGFTLRYFFQNSPFPDIRSDPALEHPNPGVIDERGIREELQRAGVSPQDMEYKIECRIVSIKINMLKRGMRNIKILVDEELKRLNRKDSWNTYRSNSDELSRMLLVVIEHTPFFAVVTQEQIDVVCEKLLTRRFHFPEDRATEILRRGNPDSLVEGQSLFSRILQKGGERGREVCERYFKCHPNPYLIDGGGKIMRQIAEAYFANNRVIRNEYDKNRIRQLIEKEEHRRQALALLGCYKKNPAAFFGMPKDVVKVIAGYTMGKDLRPPRAHFPNGRGK